MSLALRIISTLRQLEGMRLTQYIHIGRMRRTTNLFQDMDTALRCLEDELYLRAHELTASIAFSDMLTSSKHALDAKILRTVTETQLVKTLLMTAAKMQPELTFTQHGEYEQLLLQLGELERQQMRTSVRSQRPMFGMSTATAAARTALQQEEKEQDDDDDDLPDALEVNNTNVL